MLNKKNVHLLCDAKLTLDHFSLNSNGSVTIKNNELGKLLQDNLKNALTDLSVNVIHGGSKFI